jgi:retron-type reverse transcriptase
MTWRAYETGPEDRLKDLHGRVHRGAHRAQPSKRIYIPKANATQRPLGIAALEDKIVQSAVVTVLNQIYEKDFRGFSYGFRPGRQGEPQSTSRLRCPKRAMGPVPSDIDVDRISEDFGHADVADSSTTRPQGAGFGVDRDQRLRD